MDPTGAVLGNAKVTAADQDTGVAYSGETSSTGMYVIPFLPSARYRVGSSLPGFKSYARPGVAVTTGEAVPVDIQLEFGAAAKTVTVRDTPDHRANTAQHHFQQGTRKPTADRT